MKLTKLVAFIGISAMLLSSCKDKQNELPQSKETSAPKAKQPIAAANLQTASFTIEGMTCAIGCAKTIEEELSQLEGVQDAKVDFDNKLAKISFDKTIQTPQSITKVVEETGDGKTYKVSNLKS